MFRLLEFLLFESFNDYINKFSDDVNRPVVIKLIDNFKELVKSHRISGKEKDITYWMNKPLSELTDFVSNKRFEKSNKQIKKDSKKSLKVWSNDEWTAIVPLSKEASCQYGAGTRWCVSATDSHNYFDSYFHENDVTLIYFINKQNPSIKYADSVDDKSHDSREVYNAKDKLVSTKAFLEIIGISRPLLIDIEQNAKNHESVISTKTDPSHDPVNIIFDKFASIKNNFKIDTNLYVNNIDSVLETVNSYILELRYLLMQLYACKESENKNIVHQKISEQRKYAVNLDVAYQIVQHIVEFPKNKLIYLHRLFSHGPKLDDGLTYYDLLTPKFKDWVDTISNAKS